MQLLGFGKREKVHPIAMISARELKQMLDRGKDIVVLDVRRPEAYVDFPGAIPGSIRIPPDELPDRYGELPREKLIVPY